MYIHTNICIKIYTIVEIEIGHLKWSLSDKLALCKIWKMHTMKSSLTQRTRMEYKHVSILIHMLLQWSSRSWYGNHDIIFKTSRSTALNTLPLHTAEWVHRATKISHRPTNLKPFSHTCAKTCKIFDEFKRSLAGTPEPAQDLLFCGMYQFVSLVCPKHPKVRVAVHV